ncbi:MAG: fused MFS/spermidine synthase, partial [Deltaproteobacteria bacterium]|nr:fused MFS/spermidine synthase [Deltaproteobacteria bacterium]
MRSTGGLDGQEGKRTFLRLLPLFFASGAAGLLYEVVWLRMLIRAFGVTVYAVTTVLAVFMGGLALGAFLGGRLAPRLRRPLLAYGLVEAGIGLSAWASTLAMRTLPELVPAIHAAAPSLPLAPVRFVLAALVLLVPTVLMGATLPVLSGLFEGRDGERRVGFLYAVNTGGAVLGVLASGFVLLGALGETRTVLAGVAANLGVGVAALLLCRRGGPAPASPVPAPSQSVPSPVDGGPSATGLLVLYGLVGAVALGYQVVWSRLLILLVGNSVYGFSSMLAMYLVGIAAGAAVMAARLRRVRDPVPWMAGLLALGAFLSVVSLAVLTALGTAETSEAYTYSRLWSREDFLPLPLYSFVVVFPVTFCSGALFPAFVQAWTRSRPGLPEATGRLYGVNTVGAIAGSVVTGFLLIGLLGSVLTLLVAAALSLVLATVVLLRAAHDHPRRRLAALGLWPAFLLLAVFSLEDPLPAILRARLPEGSEIRFHTEDAVAATTVADTSHRNLYINGLAVSGTGYIARV